MTAPTNDQTPKLLELIAQLQQQNLLLQEQNAKLESRVKELENEITRLKKLNPQPDIKANCPSKADEKSEDLSQSVDDVDVQEMSTLEVDRPKESTPRYRTQPARPPVTEVQRIAPDVIPEGSVRNGCSPFFVQELEIQAKTIQYQLEQWLTPEGKTISGRPPESLQGHHFGCQLQAFILMQHHGCAVTQPLLLDQLWEMGISISNAQLSNLLTKGHDRFHVEKKELLTAGIRHSHYIQVDDTGDRHKGQNGYCTVITNDLFTWFDSTSSKSRANYLSLLHSPWSTYVLNDEALTYLEQCKLAKKWLKKLSECKGIHFFDKEALEAFMTDIGLDGPKLRQTVCSGILYGSLIHHGFDQEITTFSDGAQQFNVFQHAQCWLHAGRPLEKVIPVNQQQVNAQYSCLTFFWALYRDLKAYKEKPSQEQADAIRQGFYALTQTQTGCTGLQEALSGLLVIQDELLRVLDDPLLPLHNNLSESQIREHVKRRKISGGTRSDAGRQSRDTFASLKKTCRQHGFSFWGYLKDRLMGTGSIPRLSDVIKYVSCWLPCGSSRSF